MTTCFEEISACKCCGKESKHIVYGSLSGSGPSSLDGRPGRYAPVFGLIQECPHCNYSAPNIGKEYPNISELIGTPAFRELIARPDWPWRYRKFMVWAHIADWIGDIKSSANAYKTAAWAADDAGQVRLATSARLRAARRLGRLSSLPVIPDNGNPPSRKLAEIYGKKDPLEFVGPQKALIADLYRRASHFKEAELAAKSGIFSGAMGDTLKVLKFEIHLALRGSTRPHNFRDANAWDHFLPKTERV